MHVSVDGAAVARDVEGIGHEFCGRGEGGEGYGDGGVLKVGVAGGGRPGVVDVVGEVAVGIGGGEGEDDAFAAGEGLVGLKGRKRRDGMGDTMRRSGGAGSRDAICGLELGRGWGLGMWTLWVRRSLFGIGRRFW